MRAVIQRVSSARVEVNGLATGTIERGLCVMVGVALGDTAEDARWLASKVVHARLFSDEQDKMNLSVADVGGAILAISQFTLLGDLRKGRRPSFSGAMAPDKAKLLFERFCGECENLGMRVETGRFQTHMEVEISNSGPVTLLLDSKRVF